MRERAKVENCPTGPPAANLLAKAKIVWVPKAMKIMAKASPKKSQSAAALESRPLSQYLDSRKMLRQPARTPGEPSFSLGLLGQLEKDLVQPRVPPGLSEPAKVLEASGGDDDPLV